MDKRFHLSFVDSAENLTPESPARLHSMAHIPRAKGRIDRNRVEDAIAGVCDGHFVTLGSRAKILDRGERTLRQGYLRKPCKEKRLYRAFPDTQIIKSKPAPKPDP